MSLSSSWMPEHGDRGIVPRVRPCLFARIWLLVVLAGVAHGAAAQTNLVQNGTFAVTNGSTAFQFGGWNGYTSSESIAGWTSSGYNFVFLPTSSVAAGSYGNLSLYSSTTLVNGPNNTSVPANSFNNASPTGGNFIGADGAFGTLAITQTINGLTAGKTYAVSFAWAGAQQTSFSGATTETWIVDLGSSPTQTTQLINVADHGFSGWLNQTFNFVATSSSELLSFLAAGTPNGVPPFALLANVSVTKVPEPASLTLMLGAIVGMASLVRRRRASAELSRGAG